MKFTFRRGEVLRQKRRNRKNTMGYLLIPAILILFNIILLIRDRGKIEAYTDVIYEKSDSEAEMVKGTAEEWFQEKKENAVYTSSGVEDYPAFCEIGQVERPVERGLEQILARLEELSQSDSRIGTIRENYDDYPEEMLRNLANNPEMADFVLNYPEKRGTTDAVLTESEKNQEHPLFLQWDPRWGYALYGDDSVIGIAGCGPTCLSMVLYYLTGDETITPDKVAAYSMENGYWAEGQGTAWALLEEYPVQYDVFSEEIPMTQSVMKRELDEGHYLILTMGEGDFTLEGHFIVIYGYDENGFLVNDPNCVSRSRKSWSFGELEGQVKNIWSFFRL